MVIEVHHTDVNAGDLLPNKKTIIKSLYQEFSCDYAGCGIGMHVIGFIPRLVI